MVFIKLIRYFLGYVKFSAWDGFPERFINLCCLNRLSIWDVKRKGDVLYASASIKSYKQMRHIAKKSGMRMRIKKRIGAPFIIHRYRRRFGILAGVLIFAVIISVLSNMIWIIQVEGNANVESQKITGVFSELGLKAGSFKRNLNIDDIESKALSELSELSWLSVNINGSTAVIEVRERVKAPKVVDEDTPCNIRADFDGTIVKMEVYDGESVVSVGDSVTKGDLLVSGIIENKDGSFSYKHSRGVVTARTQHKIVVTVPLSSQEKEYKGETKKKLLLNIFGAKFSLNFTKEPEGSYDKTETAEYLTLFGIELPFAIETIEYKEYVMKDVTYTPEEAGEIAKKELEEKEKELLKSYTGIKITESRTNKEHTSEVLMLTGYYTCEQTISVEEEILFDKES